MKTIKKDGKVSRVTDKIAFESVRKGWEFCPKSEWKEKVRDVKTTKSTKKKEKKDN